jgi:peptide/nickel transport system substrate-binding protein
MKYAVRVGLLLLAVILCAGCSKKKAGSAESVVIGIPSDIDNFNPVFAEEETAGEIGELIFPMLMGSEFDTVEGTLQYYPLLARSWESADGNRDIVFHLRSNACWSDTVRVTGRDVQFSYELYGNEQLASVRQIALDNLRKTKDGKLDVRQSIEVVDDSTVIFHFSRSYPGQLFDAGLPILPSHIYEKIPLGELRTCRANRNPVGAGPFALASWKANQEIILKPNVNSTLPYPAKLRQLIFRILPEQASRFAQLKTGEIDVLADLTVEEARELEDSHPGIEVVSIPGRRYQFIGWNNIDGDAYSTSKGKSIRPHNLFGNPDVRKALTLAIDRRGIVKGLLGSYGMEMVGPVSPIFKWAYNDSLSPLPYDPHEALALLTKEGWKMRSGGDILEKNGVKFRFKLRVVAGAQTAMSVANVVQKQLREVHIDAVIDQIERSVFWDDLMQKKFDAFIGGFEIPLQLQLEEFWGSDLKKNQFNLVSYRNEKVDRLLKDAKNAERETDAASDWKAFQSILFRDQPCTFLFWESTAAGVNKRLRGTHIGILGTTDRAWDWYVE